MRKPTLLARGAGYLPRAQVSAGLVAAEVIVSRDDVDCHAVAISVMSRAYGAQRLCEGLGFTHDPGRDWTPAPGVEVYCYRVTV